MVHYKSIIHERTEDAPFIGALICATNCKFNCENCFNQDIKNMPTLIKNHKEIIHEIKDNKFNQGIILAGLEWSLQPEELKLLVYEALRNDLQVMIYTGMNEEDFDLQFADLIKLPIYVKYGRYDENYKDDNYYCYGIKLATSNQKIYKKGNIYIETKNY